MRRRNSTHLKRDLILRDLGKSILPHKYLGHSSIIRLVWGQIIIQKSRIQVTKITNHLFGITLKGFWTRVLLPAVRLPHGRKRRLHLRFSDLTASSGGNRHHLQETGGTSHAPPTPSQNSCSSFDILPRWASNSWRLNF